MPLTRRRLLGALGAAAGAALFSARSRAAGLPSFLSRPAPAGATAASAPGEASAAPAGPAGALRMTIDLVCGAIGVRAGQVEAIDLAHRHGFESVGPDAGHLAALSADALAGLLDSMRAKDLVFGAAGLPVEFRQDDARFSEDLAALPRTAAGLRRAGVTRVGTWLSPSHDELTYLANFRRHAARMRRIADALGEHGLRLGLEYVGPRTSWTRGRHAFIHTMAETRELIAEIDRKNVGITLDSWHWYHARETADDIRRLRNEDVVAVDLNDAPAGVPIDEQMDSRRELPAATGVIDLRSFLGALREIGYDGPVRAEPFNAALRALPPEEAVAATAAAMRKAFALLEDEPPAG